MINELRMKELLKQGRKLNEYIDESGKLRIDCITCIHRPSLKDLNFKRSGGWICGSLIRFHRCNPHRNFENNWRLDHMFWEPRVDVNFLKEEDLCL